MNLDNLGGNFTIVVLDCETCCNREYLYDYEISFPLTSSTLRPGQCLWRVPEMCPDGSWKTCSSCSGNTTEWMNLILEG